MDIRLVAVPVGLIVILIGFGRWGNRIINAVTKALKWFWKVFQDSSTCEVAKTCCGEAAVLLLVFPTLDTLYDHRKLSDPQLHQSIEVAGLFFVFAVILSHAEKRGRGE